MDVEERSLYLREVRKNGGKLVNAVVFPLEEASGYEADDLRSDLKTGWSNSYLGA